MCLITGYETKHVEIHAIIVSYMPDMHLPFGSIYCIWQIGMDQDGSCYVGPFTTDYNVVERCKLCLNSY